MPHQLHHIGSFISDFYKAIAGLNKKLVIKNMAFEKEDDGRDGDPFIEYFFSNDFSIKNIKAIYILQDWDRGKENAAPKASNEMTCFTKRKPWDSNSTFRNMEHTFRDSEETLIFIKNLMRRFLSREILIINAVPGLRISESSIGDLFPDVHALAYEYYWGPLLRYLMTNSAGKIPVFLCGRWAQKHPIFIKKLAYNNRISEDCLNVRDEIFAHYTFWSIQHPYSWFNSHVKRKLIEMHKALG